MTEFADWFESITGKIPFPYQANLATRPELPLFLDAPTGAGKTAAIALALLWRWFKSSESIQKDTPRRLVYCLPMRTLVDQTYGEIKTWLEEAKLTDQVGLHMLMGGAVDLDWDGDPLKRCILIGTQDQLISRALNRGYSMSRYRWPIHFALLNNDCLWVMDETQLMGAGLQTTAQLQGFRQKLTTYGVTRSLWMSATLDPELLDTVDYTPDAYSKLHLGPDDLEHPVLKQRLDAQKPLQRASTVWSGEKNPKKYAKALASEVLTVHQPDQLTLVICNRVDRAQAIYQELSKSDQSCLLIHSRFRANDRERSQSQLKTYQGIVVATQAIEAGVDISAAVMFTELAPWSSLVQRFGRCNRRGEQNDSAQVYWIDVSDLKKKDIAIPYEPRALGAARSLLQSLSDVGYHSLERVRQDGNVPREDVDGLIPRRYDLLQLFDTSVDLAGHDVDISSFIRDSDNADVAIAWRNWSQAEQPAPPKDMEALRRDELCRVSVYRAREFIKALHNQNPKRFAWVWDGMQGEWVSVSPSTPVYPGMSLLLHCDGGGYSEALGFTGNAKDKVKPISPEPEKTRALEPESDADSKDQLTQTGQSITLQQHSDDVAKEVKRLCDGLAAYGFEGDRPNLASLLTRAGRWHDSGKAHPAFQEMLGNHQPDGKPKDLLAKSGQYKRMAEERRGFRHELVSALLALAEGEDFLLAYVVACHHGKVRMTIQPRPMEKRPKQNPKYYALGVWEGDRIDSINLGDGLVIPEHTLSLACMEMGDTDGVPSWNAQAIALLDEFGPFKLAFLESVLRLADWRVSKGYSETSQGGHTNDG
ncbi:MAG: CRISPR-associated helicase Cas3' [Cyanobacteria bacterium P01_F01_bin.150]